MNRYEKIQQAKEDFAKGLISEEEFRDIMEDCDYDEIKQEADLCDDSEVAIALIDKIKKMRKSGLEKRYGASVVIVKRQERYHLESSVGE